MTGKEENFTSKIISLQKAYHVSRQLAGKIVETDSEFDLVIAIARGGLPPARFVCDFLNVSEITSIQIKHYLSGSHEIEQVLLLDPLRATISGKKVLLIDDVNDSGKTLKAAYEHVNSFEPEVLKTGVLHEKQNSTYRANFVGERLENWEWLIYQWAVTEDVLEFLKKADMLNANVQDAVKYLKGEYSLDINEELLQQIVEMKGGYY